MFFFKKIILKCILICVAITLKDKEINPNLLWEIIHKPYIPEHKTLQISEVNITFLKILKFYLNIVRKGTLS